MFYYDITLGNIKRSVAIFSMPILDSRMYVISGGSELLIVDPVLIVDEDERQKLQDICRDSSHATILVTHSHYDHIAGLNDLRKIIPLTVYATPLCDEKMRDPHKNLSAYSLALVIGKTDENQKYCEEHFDMNYSCSADNIYENDLEINSIPAACFKTIPTPGHSDCSQCIEWYENGSLFAVFTGDSLVNGHEIILRFPTGNKHKYQDITEPYLMSLPDDILILPGHGDPIQKSEIF